jgi:hypothetical protein
MSQATVAPHGVMEGHDDDVHAVFNQSIFQMSSIGKLPKSHTNSQFRLIVQSIHSLLLKG